MSNFVAGPTVGLTPGLVPPGVDPNTIVFQPPVYAQAGLSQAAMPQVTGQSSFAAPTQQPQNQPSAVQEASADNDSLKRSSDNMQAASNQAHMQQDLYMESKSIQNSWEKAVQTVNAMNLSFADSVLQEAIKHSKRLDQLAAAAA